MNHLVRSNTTYKRHYSTIEKAILSVINQTYKYIEVILVDDNLIKIYRRGKEGLKPIAKSTIYQIKEIKELAARNNGILNAKGEFVAFR